MTRGLAAFKEIFLLKRHRSFFESIKAQKFDIYIDDSGYIFSAIAGFKANIPLRIGRNNQGFGFLNHYEYPYDFDENLTFKKLMLLKPLGIQATQRQDYRPVIDISDTFAKKVLHSHKMGDLDNCYFVVFPFAGWKAKNWDANKFSYVISEFYKYSKLMPVLLGGSNNKEDILSITSELEMPYKNMVGVPSLDETIAIISRSSLYFGVDSVGAHLAAATNVKSLTMFGPTNPEKIAYLGENNIAVTKKISCSPSADKIYCYRDAGRRCPHISCMRELREEDVLAALKNLWDGNIKSEVIEF
jgi:ADP-heptose:LPS heptosyltransferase